MRLARLLPVLLLAATLPCITLAQQDDDQDPPKQSAPQTEKTDEQKEIEKFEKAIKDLPVFEGEFTLYQKKKEVLLVIPEAKLGKLFFAQATVGMGVGMDGLQSGDPLNQDFVDTFQFELGSNEDIRLVKPNLKHRWLADNPLARASQLSFPNAILANYKIEAKHPTKKLYLINITRFFDGSLFKLQNIVNMTAGMGYSPDSANSDLLSIKSFPENTVVKYGLHFRKGGFGDDDGGSLLALLLGLSTVSPLTDTRSLPLSVVYNLWFDRDTGYQPRLADPRVGYFTTDYFDVDKLKQPLRDTKLINRFHLVKKNPGLALSEPVKPIVWYLDKTIPAEYKDAVRSGILFWNKAFEAIGYKNALVVKDAPDDPDFDGTDGRHNVVRWIMSRNSAYAVAWFRPSPVTGEILNAAVTVDANYPASALTEFKTEVLGVTRRPWIDEWYEMSVARTKIDRALRGTGYRKVACDHAHELMDEGRYGFAALQASGLPVDAKEYADILVADLIAHEVGHCLGLRHNFAASTLHPSQKLKDFETVSKLGVASSVMDYTPVNVAAVLAGNKGYYNPTIGAYDLWAIQYGYADVPGTTMQEEVDGLSAIARRSGEPGLMYLTDEDADGVNPLAVRWDLGQDLLGYLTDRATADRLIQNYAVTKATGVNEPYTVRNGLILRTIRGRYRSASTASRIVGGVEFRRQFKGDNGEVPTLRPVAAAKQRDAMRFIIQNALLADLDDLPQNVLHGLSQNPDIGGAEYIAPLRQYIGMQQRVTLGQLTNQDKIFQITENAFKTKNEADRYTLTEHYNMLFSAVFAEIGQNKSIAPLKRDLQRYFVTILIGQSTGNAGMVNDDARMICSAALGRIKTRISQQLAKGDSLDEITILHLQDLNGQIDRFLKRQATLPPN
ncbi:zinc-dependent metalloprotease [Kamptonema cortianum]|nr:zinc-dependent metalloprotease [Kamptonema cortianum]